MSMDYIRRTYGVPAKSGVRVRYTGGKVERLGTVRSASGAHLMIHLDGDKRATGPFHPTWELEYLTEGAANEQAG